MASYFDPRTGKWLHDAGITPQQLQRPPVGATAPPTPPYLGPPSAPSAAPNWDFSKLTPEQQKAYADLTPDQRRAAAQMGNPPAGLDLGKYFSGGPSSAPGAAPTLPSSNGGPGSQDTATIQSWLKSQGVPDKDLGYFTTQIQSKSDGLSQANAQYWSDKISGVGSGGGSGGGSGLYGPQNTFTPLGQFGGIGNAPSSSFNPGGIGAPAPYQYQPIQGSNPFSFPGVYQPPPPRQAAPPPQAAPRPTPQAQAPTPPADPSQGSPIPNGILVNGGWRDKNDQSPDVQAVVQQYAQAQQQYQTALQQFQATPASTPPIGSSNPNEGIAPSNRPDGIGQSSPNEGIAPGNQIGSNGGGDAWYYAPGGPGGPPLPSSDQIGRSSPNEGIPPGGQIGSSSPNEGVSPGGQIGTSGRGDAWYYAPGGPGGPPAGAAPPGGDLVGRSGWQQPAPVGSPGGFNSLYAAGLTLPTYQPQSPFSADGPPQIAGFTPNGQINAQHINAPTPLSYSPLQSLNPYQTPPSLSYDPLQSPGTYQAPTPLNAPSLQTPGAYTPGTFTAPTAEDAKNDPGYQFRLDQGSQALQQSAVARGGLLSTGTAKALNDYGQQSASQEYNNVYARQLAAFQAKEAAGQSAYGLNTGTQLAAEAQQYGQAANTQAQNANQGLAAYQTNAQTGLAYHGQGYNEAANTQAQNAAQGLAGYQTNAQTGLAYQGQQFGQAAQTQAQNAAQDLTAQQSNATLSQQAQQNSYANALAGYQTNAQTQLAQQNQGYNQAANTYGLNAQTGQNAYALNAQTQLGAQNQAFNQSFNTSQANAQNSFQVQQANAANAFQVYQGNFGNALNAYQASTGAQYNAAALNAQTANQAWQNDYTQAWNTYQSQVQQQEAAAGLGFQYANLWLQQQGQYYNQAANTYGINYNSQYQQPFNNNLAIAQLGYGAATNPYGQNYANNAGNLYTGMGNANAAGQVGAQNAYNGAYQGIAQAPWLAYGAYQNRNGAPPPFSPNNPYQQAPGAGGY